MTNRYAVFGNPVSHSKSPHIHMAFARQTGQDIAYEAIEAPAGGLKETIAAFTQSGGKGFNITVPFKLEALALATSRSRHAELAGATNCIKIEGGELLAENFDGVGIVRDIEINQDYPLAGRKVLLVGAGGASRGAILPILEAKPAALTIVNRTAAKALELKAAFASFGDIGACGYDDLAVEPFDLVINATSASLHGDMPPLRPENFAKGCLAYDMMYGKGMTPFLRFAGGSGAATLVDGVGMLVEQAAEAFAWWRGVRPGTAPVIAELTVPLT